MPKDREQESEQARMSGMAEAEGIALEAHEDWLSRNRKNLLEIETIVAKLAWVSCLEWLVGEDYISMEMFHVANSHRDEEVSKLAGKLDDMQVKYLGGSSE